MEDFQRKKDSNQRLNTITQRENSYILSDQTKNLYDFVLKHDSQIKTIESEMNNLKSQLTEVITKLSLNPSQNINNNYWDENNNSSSFNQIIKYKEDIKNDLMKDINNVIISQKKEFNEKIENLKIEIELINSEKNNNNKILEINDSLETINQQLLLKNEEKSNLENIIMTKINNNKNEINNTIINVIKRIDSFDMDFDRLVQSLKKQFLTNANTISQLEISKVNINDYENQINIINQNIEELSSKLNNINLKSINNKNIFSDAEIKNELTTFKNDIYNDLENINLKILNELSNQAEDIKSLYQKVETLEENTTNQKVRDLNFESPKNISGNSLKMNLLEQIDNSSDKINSLNLISIIESELSKKANLDQLNFALETQSKLNDAFSSASRICRFCWDSEGVLKDDKYIIWSIQNINTALDVFKWENNSESISILQNGIYKIVIGLIDVDKNKNFGIIFNDDENIIVDSRINNNYGSNDFENENDIVTDKGNVKFMEKYIACVENTKIKAILFDNSNENNDCSEEAFLEIIKII
jgi:DNA repair exonuclease SbcCD ATPase subunit